MSEVIMKTLALLLLSLGLVAPAAAQTKSPATWQAEFQNLVTGLPRVQAEREIARIRNVKSTYELYAMDTSAWVAYRLDDQTILLVNYRPGTPAAHGINGQGGHAPVDGTLLTYQTLQLR